MFLLFARKKEETNFATFKANFYQENV